MTSRVPLLPPPPPLPLSLSTRFLSTINPQTGACKRHPSVQLCKLAQNNSRWVVRRKICSKCGARAPVGGGRHTPGVSVRVDNPYLGTRRSQSAPPASDRRRSATPARRRQSCDERQGDAAPNLTAASFKSRTISTGSMSFRSESAGTSTDDIAIEVVRKLDARNKNNKSDKKKYSSHNDDTANEYKHTSRRGRKKDILPSANFDDTSPAQVRFAPSSVHPYIPPPPFHREIPSHSIRRKQSSINSMEDDIIKNVGCIYFYPMT